MNSIIGVRRQTNRPICPETHSCQILFRFSPLISGYVRFVSSQLYISPTTDRLYHGIALAELALFSYEVLVLWVATMLLNVLYHKLANSISENFVTIIVQVATIVFINAFRMIFEYIS